MANVFISHSSADSAWADQIRGWLVADGHDVFLDQHQNDGIVVGEEWERRLYERLRWADAVVCLITQNYLESVWCAGEIGAARALGIEILPVQVGSADGQHKLLKSIQAVDVSECPEKAQQVLLSRLNVIDGGGGLGWPDDKSPYPGLRSFELGEHRVFFGRGSEITAIAERLRSPERNTAEILTVVGPSGCGKSSLIRAGVAARIAGESYWLVVPPIVPGTDPLGTLARALADLVLERKIEFDTATLRQQLEANGLKGIANDLLVAAGVDSRCKLLVVIDQFEELITQTDAECRAKFVDCVSPALGGPVQALATVRPEYLDALTRDPSLGSLALRLQPIRPLDYEALRTIIEKPAAVAGLRFEDGLVDRLIADTGSGEALPLLAFTLRQLARGVGRGGQLSLQRYADIGGVQGALRQQADEALHAACAATGLTQDQVITELLDLVTIDEHGHPSKRRVGYDESSTVLAGLQPFLDGRLLTTETVSDRTLITVAHDSFLTNWRPLTEEIDNHVSALRARRVVENAARDWVAGDRDQAALLQRRPLAKVMDDLGARVEPLTDVARDVLRAPVRPRRRRLTTRVDLEDTAREFLEVSAAKDRSRRMRVLTGVAAVISILAVIAGYASVQRGIAEENAHDARSSAKEAIAQRLIADARVKLQSSGNVGYLQQLLVGNQLASSEQPDPLYQVVVDSASTYKIMQNPPAPPEHGGGPWPMESMAVSRDGGLIATGGDDQTVRLWNADTGQVVTTINVGGEGAVWAVAFDPSDDKLAVGGDNKELRVLDPETGHIAVTIPHPTSVRSVSFSRDGELIATGDATGTVRVWNVASGQIQDTILPNARDTVARSVAFSPTGEFLAYTDGENVRLWDVRNREPVTASPAVPSFLRTALAFSPNGELLAAGGRGGAIQILNGHTLEPVGLIQAHPGNVGGLAFSPDPNGVRIVSGGDDQVIKVWNVNSILASKSDGQRPIKLDPEYTFRGHTALVSAVGFAQDGLRIVSASIDGTVREWSAVLGLPIATDQGSEIRAVAFSPDNVMVASGGSDGTVKFWKTASGAASGIIGTPSPPGDSSRAINSLAYNKDGTRLVTASTDGRVSLWDMQHRRHIGDLVRVNPEGGKLGRNNRIQSVTFDPEGKYIAAGGFDGVVRVWDANTGAAIRVARTSKPSNPDMPYQIWSVAYSPDGKHLVTGSGFDAVPEPGKPFIQNNLVQIWNAETLTPDGPPMMGNPDTNAYAARFSNNGEWVVSSSSDGTLRVWDSESGKLKVGPAELNRDQSPVYSLALPQHGDWVATGAGGGTVRVWYVMGEPPEDTSLQGHHNWVLSVAVSLDGRMIASGSADGNVRLWPAPTDVNDALCKKLTVNPSEKQWKEWVAPSPDEYVPICQGLDPVPDSQASAGAP